MDAHSLLVIIVLQGGLIIALVAAIVAKAGGAAPPICIRHGGVAFTAAVTLGILLLTFVGA